jgi:hypothetical protein
LTSDSRRLYLNNWAILIAENQVKWFFGDIKDEEVLKRTLDFVNSLSNLGSTIWGQEIGTIRLRYPRSHPSQAREIMVVSLMGKYSIVISDPLVTTRLMTQIDVKSNLVPNLKDDMRSILAGTASVIYSQFYSHKELLDRKVVDDLFQQAVRAVTYNEDVTVKNGQCSFSALTIEELLFFHALLKEIFENYVKITVPGRPWGVINSVAGTPVYLKYNTPIAPALICAFSSAIVTYCRLLFGAYPERLVFGGYSISGIDFITTNKNIFVLSNPTKLLGLQKFIQAWKKVPNTVKIDLKEIMKSYLVELSVAEYREEMKKKELHQLINSVTGMGIKRARNYQIDPPQL